MPARPDSRPGTAPWVRGALVAFTVALLAATGASGATGAPPPEETGAPGAELPPLVAVSTDDLVRLVRESRSRALMVNVWATWCLPCREEMPDLLRLRERYAGRGLRLLLVSGDFEGQEDEARAFLRDQGVDFTTYQKTGSDQDFIDALSPDWSGALPATFVFGPEGKLLRFHEGKASYRQFEAMVLEALGGDAPGPEED